MNRNGLVLAGALILAPALALASSHRAGHPASPGGDNLEPVHESPFAAGVPLLNRDAPHPSNWPASNDTAQQQGESMGLESVDHSGMDHSGMDHEGMMRGGVTGTAVTPAN